MKKIILLITIGLIFATSSACADTGTDDTGIQERYVFITPLRDNSYWNKVAEGVIDACGESNVSLKCMGSLELNKEEQVEYIYGAIAAKVDGIITTALDTDEFEEALLKAREEEIPVVLVDNDNYNSTRNIYIGTDNYKAGYLAGNEMIDATEGSAHIGIIVSTLDTPNQIERVKGFTDAVSDRGQMEITEVIEGKSDLLLIPEKLNALLEKHPEIDAFFCAEGNGGVALGNTLKPEEMNRYTVIAFDNAPEVIQSLKDQFFYGTMIQDTYGMGYKAVKDLKKNYATGSEGNTTLFTEAYIVHSNEYRILEKETEAIKWYSY